MKKKLVGVLLGSFLVLGSALNVGAVENDKNCDDFASHNDVLAFWYENGYSADNDPHDLDRDNDGLACEVTQSEYDSYVASQEANDSSGETVTEQETAVEDKTEEGAALPKTASNGPLMMLFGAGLAGAGSLLLFRRRKQSA
ncbi:excalibur calcium-binding domain-containing protein [Planococcus versutus]|uniref:Cell surface protein n=1 Tax=Planococcus versutus TaxID=1302659 RepID=A0A1B1RYS6_9BACL|nr:excalibur calcium-binding domain-containing protein [Planococcus versutus]ANU26118.1 cell surface protein [Planococcus versutus]